VDAPELLRRGFPRLVSYGPREECTHHRLTGGARIWIGARYAAEPGRRPAWALAPGAVPVELLGVAPMAGQRARHRRAPFRGSCTSARGGRRRSDPARAQWP
jgi:hypothetical protein